MGSPTVEESEDKVIGEKHLIEEVSGGDGSGRIGGGEVEASGENEEIGGVALKLFPVASGDKGIFRRVNISTPFFGVVWFVEENNIAILSRPGERIKKNSPRLGLINGRFLPEAILVGGGEPDNGNEFKKSKLIEGAGPACQILFVFADDKGDITPLATITINKAGGGFEVVFIDDVNAEAVIGDFERVDNGKSWWWKSENEEKRKEDYR